MASRLTYRIMTKSVQGCETPMAGARSFSEPNSMK